MGEGLPDLRQGQSDQPGRHRCTANPSAQQRFSHIHVDIVGPLPISKEGFRYLFTIINRSSRMLEAVPLTNIERETCRDPLFSQWVARFVLPAHLISDQGAQFTSALWARTCDVIGTHHNTTTAYHLQSNGMVERAQQWLKEVAADWPQHLPWVLLDFNNAPKDYSGMSAAEMVYGTTLTLPTQLAAGCKQPVDKILQDLATAAPLPTRHGQREAPTEPPVALAAGDLGIRAQGWPAATAGAALQRTLQRVGEGTQVLPPGHRRKAHGGHSGLPQATHRRSCNHTSGPAPSMLPTH